MINNKYFKGRDVTMIAANAETGKNTYGTIVEFLPNYNICDYLKVRWENGIVSEVPAHWVATFSCDDED